MCDIALMPEFTDRWQLTINCLDFEALASNPEMRCIYNVNRTAWLFSTAAVDGIPHLCVTFYLYNVAICCACEDGLPGSYQRTVPVVY